MYFIELSSSIILFVFQNYNEYKKTLLMKNNGFKKSRFSKSKLINLIVTYNLYKLSLNA